MLHQLVCMESIKTRLINVILCVSHRSTLMVPGRSTILVFEAFQSVNYPPPADLFADLTSLRFAQISDSPDHSVGVIPVGLFALPNLFFAT